MSMDCFKEYNSDDIDDLLLEKIEFERHMENRFKTEGIDAVISPAFYHSAFKHEDASDLAIIADYTTIWNILSYPAGVVPVTKVEKGDEERFDDKWKDLLSLKFKNSIRGSTGMPVNVQIATPKWQDEECLAIMQVLSEALNLPKPVILNGITPLK